MTDRPSLTRVRLWWDHHDDLDAPARVFYTPTTPAATTTWAAASGVLRCSVEPGGPLVVVVPMASVLLFLVDPWP